MIKKLTVAALVLVFFAQSAFSFDKFPVHLAGAVVGEGLGIYSSVTGILYGQSDVTKAAGYANIGLLATGATVGVLAWAGVGDYETMVVIHRIVGYAVFAASVWLSVSTTLDEGTRNSATPYTSYGYAALSLAPIILFSIPF